jgi:hypothetical protein
MRIGIHISKGMRSRLNAGAAYLEDNSLDGLKIQYLSGTENNMLGEYG